MQSVPFKINEVHGGLSSGHGAAYVDEEDLVLEIQTALFSFVKQRPKVYRIDLTDLESVEYDKGFREDRLTLRTRPMDRLAGVPGVAEGQLCLRFARKDRKGLAVLLDRLDLWRTN